MPAESRLSSYRIDGPFVQQTRRYGTNKSAGVNAADTGYSGIPAIEFMPGPFRSIMAKRL